MDANEEELQESGVRVSTRSKITSKRLERLYGLKNERSGYLSTVTARRKDIEALLADEENVELVKEKLSRFLAAFETILMSRIHRTFPMRLALRDARNNSI